MNTLLGLRAKVEEDIMTIFIPFLHVDMFISKGKFRPILPKEFLRYEG